MPHKPFRNQTQAFRLLRQRYQAGIKAVQLGADPALTLSLVLWPTLEVRKAELRKAA